MHGTRFIFIPGPRDPGPQTLLGGPGHSSDPFSHAALKCGFAQPSWGNGKRYILFFEQPG